MKKTKKQKNKNNPTNIISPNNNPNPIKIIPKIKLAVPIMLPNYFELDYKLRIFRKKKRKFFGYSNFAHNACA